MEERNSEIVQNNLSDAIISQSKIYLESGDYSNAIEGFVKAISRGTKDSYAYFGLAKAYRNTGINDKATEYYEKAISMNPDEKEYSEEYADFISAINSIKEKEIKMRKMKGGSG